MLVECIIHLFDAKGIEGKSFGVVRIHFGIGKKDKVFYFFDEFRRIFSYVRRIIAAVLFFVCPMSCF